MFVKQATAIPACRRSATAASIRRMARESYAGWVRWPLIVVAAALPGLVLLSAAAQPQIPATFYGTVIVDGEAPGDGADIRGFIGDVDCTQIGSGPRYLLENGIGSYVINVMHESQKPGCGNDGATVTFTVNGAAARQTATWAPGPKQVGLSVGEGSPPPLPAPTPTPVGTPTSASSDDPGNATPTLRTGTPPTDDITLTPGASSTASPGGPDASGTRGAVAASAEDLGPGDGGGAGAWPYIALIAGVVAIAGGGVGIFLSRRGPA